MIGPIGLLLHMAGAAIVGVFVGAFGGMILANYALIKRANERGLRFHLDEILESDKQYAKRNAYDLARFEELIAKMRADDNAFAGGWSKDNGDYPKLDGSAPRG